MAPSTASASSPLQAKDHVGGISGVWPFLVEDLGPQVPEITSRFSPLRYETSPAAYDTQNLRVRVKDASGDRRILLDGIEEIGEYDTTTGERIKRYDHDPSRVDGLLAQKGDSGQKLNAYSDALGSVYGLVDSQGTAQAKYSYDVYGARTASLENVGTDWGFTGRRFDGATGLGYYRARYYGAEVGLFGAVDPLPLSGMFPGQFRDTAFSYAQGNPVLNLDPSGMYSTGAFVDDLLLVALFFGMSAVELAVTAYGIQKRDYGAGVVGVWLGAANLELTLASTLTDLATTFISDNCAAEMALQTMFSVVGLVANLIITMALAQAVKDLAVSVGGTAAAAAGGSAAGVGVGVFKGLSGIGNLLMSFAIVSTMLLLANLFINLAMSMARGNPSGRCPCARPARASASGGGAP